MTINKAQGQTLERERPEHSPPHPAEFDRHKTDSCRIALVSRQTSPPQEKPSPHRILFPVFADISPS
ncbi:hypothetical protein EMIHUDRAFT_222512 [Emiliania huxleyi CCMP1516]|uniref:Uncharacterized protein n=2 Tax=Emiliania huxleyi TaxID=2903 RepID=A0A0D3KYB0_EMIH1|nr:hypothetical protein EMIHUDRAFT_222512 [Emiliania huxleyi CCMP1516]EOD40745.1 hypothetical protein EMIHUDRAFT_222512 [Emiliania huxleyi CCMP1516]|eukprot:XP_005793174.1 hypothetical protein EMIHUDRAFT_222512 [Emiliania huxleyi CCMP1516]